MDYFSQHDQLYTLVIIFSWVFAEAGLLSTWGSTPGKWLLSISILDKNGNKLNYNIALKRSLGVYWCGMGIGFPIVSLITLIIAHGKLTKNGITTWDKSEHTIVTHNKINPFCAIIVALFLILFIFLIIADKAKLL